GGGGRGGFRRVTASMTTAGLACLFICKAHLDGQASYEKNLRGPIDKSLRDGAAWLAKNFSVTQNGGEDNGANQGGGQGGGQGGRGRAPPHPEVRRARLVRRGLPRVRQDAGGERELGRGRQRHRRPRLRHVLR